MILYVSAPYSATTPERVHLNVCYAMDVAELVRGLGHTPIVPHLSHFLHLHWCCLGRQEDWGFWMQKAKVLLRVCDAMLLTGNWKSSTGCRQELLWAREMGLPIYIGIDSVPAVPKDAKGDG